MSEEKLTDEARGRLAKRALADPAIKAAFDHLEENAILTWKASDLTETETRESAYHQQRAVEEIRGLLETWSRDAK